jgi:hypothetical protein
MKEKFEKNSFCITLNRADQKLMEQCGAEANAHPQNKKKKKKDELVFDADHSYYVSRALSTQMLLEKERLEKGMMVDPVEVGKISQEGCGPPLGNDHLALYDDDKYNEDVLVPRVEAIMVDDEEKQQLQQFRDIGVQCLYLASARARYLLNQWQPGENRASSAGPDEQEMDARSSPRKKKAKEVDTSKKLEVSSVEQARAMGYTPLDSRILTHSGAEAMDWVRRWVLKHLAVVYGEDKVRQRNEGRQEADKRPVLVNDIQPTESMTEMEMWTGAIQTGNTAVHQDFHVDNEKVFQMGAMHSYMHGTYASVEECEEAGYIIDIPLSKEGAVIRVMYPCPIKKELVMDYLYVPHGAILVRSAVVWHSGHYGSPGNFRVHCNLVKKDSPTADNVLGYLSDFVSKEENKDEFQNMKVRWAEHVVEYLQKPVNALKIAKNGSVPGEPPKKRNPRLKMPRYSQKLLTSSSNYYKVLDDDVDGFGTSDQMKIALAVLNPYVHFGSEVVELDSEDDSGGEDGGGDKPKKKSEKDKSDSDESVKDEGKKQKGKRRKKKQNQNKSKAKANKKPKTKTEKKK